MKKREINKIEIKDEQDLACELCNTLLNEKEILDISKKNSSTVLCGKCSKKFDNLSSFYDD